MTKQQIKECYDLIKEYKEEPNQAKQQMVRNQIFFLLTPHLEKWVKSILSSRGIFVDQPELLSQSWDCFEFCLKHYKPEGTIPVPNHFYAYTKFYLSMYAKKESRKQKRQTFDVLQANGKNRGVFGDGGRIIYHTADKGKGSTNIDDVLKIEDSFLSVYEHIDELKSFRILLPKEYITVFDDAIMSMCAGHTQNLQRLNLTTLSYSKYQEVKKVFKIIINFLLTK